MLFRPKKNMHEQLRRTKEKNEVGLFLERKKHEILKTSDYDIVTVCELLSSLSNLVKEPASVEELRGVANLKVVFFDEFYDSLVVFLLSKVAIQWLPCFSTQQRKNNFDVFFSVQFAPPVNVFISLYSLLSNSKKQPKDTTEPNSTNIEVDDINITNMNCVRLLDSFFSEQHGLRQLFSDLLLTNLAQPPLSREKMLLIIRFICSLPDLVHNRTNNRPPDSFTVKPYFKKAINTLFQVVLTLESSDLKFESPSFFGYLIEKLCFLNKGEQIANSWVSCLQKRKPSKIDSTEFHRLLFENLPESTLEKVTFHMLRSMGEKLRQSDFPNDQLVDFVCKMMSRRMRISKHFQYIIFKKVIIGTELSVEMCEMIVKLLVSSESLYLDDKNIPKSLPFQLVLNKVINYWSADGVSSSKDFKLLQSLSRFIRASLREVSKSALEEYNWTALLIKGVQNHMSNPLTKIKALGMNVAEDVSVIISPDNPLRFDYSDGESESDQVSAINIEQKTSKREKRRKKDISFDTSNRSLNRFEEIDPDEIVDSCSEDENFSEKSIVEERCSSEPDDGDSSSDISFDEYDLDDDEDDLAKFEKPVYLKDILNSLQKNDELERVEVALFSLEGQVRSLPSDLHEISSSLAAALLNLENKYNLDNFVKNRSSGLLSLVVCSPLQVVPFLTKQLLEINQLFQSKIEILQALVDAANELSHSVLFQKSSTAKNEKKKIEKQIDDVASKTRRWGYRRNSSPIPQKNKFASYAGIFFYPLLYGYRPKCKDGSIMVIDLDNQLLAHLLRALASFVECSGHSFTTMPMARCLLDFSLSFRSNRNANVRRQVLYAVSRVLLVTPPHQLRTEIATDLTAVLSNWLHYTVQNDSDDGCRNAARLLVDSGFTIGY